MDDFRVGSISPYDPDHRQELHGPVKRKRDKRTEDDQPLEEDEVVMASGESEAGEEPIQDYYEPSSRTEEPE